MAAEDVFYADMQRRPYYPEIYAPDGQKLVPSPPDFVNGGGGPMAIGGQHPTDYYGAVDHPDKPGCGLARRNCD